MKNRLFDVRFENDARGLLLSNAFGSIARLSGVSARRLASGRLGAALTSRLERDNFFSDRLDLEYAYGNLAEHYFAGYAGPYIHIVTLTTRCNLACSYCSASAGAGGEDMTEATANRLLDFAFAVRDRRLTLEFQGGEPLLNFGLLRHMVLRAERLNRAAGKRLHFSVVTNMQAMDARKLDFLEEHGVSVCVSFDAVKRAHDANRVSRNGSNYDRVVRWLAEIARRRAAGSAMEAPNAICTVSRALLDSPEEVVDSFARNGLNRVQLGPLDPLGRAAGNAALRYSHDEYFAFYRRALKRMAALTLSTGRAVYEKGAFNVLKMAGTARRNPHRNLELLIRLAYDRNGDIYPSDEARMLADSGDALFRLGDVRRDTFEGLLRKPLARALVASCFAELSQPRCARCPYSRYCRVSPVYNYIFQGSFWGNLPSSERCRFYRSMFSLVLGLRERREWRRVLDIWLEEGVD